MKIKYNILLLVASALLLHPFSSLNADDQLFGGKEKDSDSNNKAS